MPTGGPLRREPVRIEGRRIVPQPRAPVQNVQIAEDVRPGLHLHGAEVHVTRGRAREERTGGEQPQRLVQHLLVKGEPIQRLGRHGPVAEHLLHFRQEAGLHLWRVRDQVQRPGERDGRRLVARADEGHDVVDQLPVAEAAPAFGVARRHQCAQEIAALQVRRPPPLHRLARLRPESAQPAEVQAPPRSRDPGRRSHHVQRRGPHHHLPEQRPGHRLRRRSVIAGEQGVHDHLERGAPHLRLYVDSPRGGAESRCRGFRGGDEGRRHPLQRLVPESRGGRPALPPPLRPLRRQQAFPDRGPERPLLDLRPPEGVGLVEQDSLHQLGIADGQVLLAE